MSLSYSSYQLRERDLDLDLEQEQLLEVDREELLELDRDWLPLSSWESSPGMSKSSLVGRSDFFKT